MVHGWVALFTIAAAALAQDAPVAAGVHAGATVPSGVPLRVAIDRRIVIKHVGEPIQGRLVEPVYVFDRVAIPAGSVVEGHIAAIGGVPARRRLAAILSGNFTPPREVRAQFDALILRDGSRFPLRTALSRGTAHTLRSAAPAKARAGNASARQSDRNGFAGMDPAAIRAFTAPGKMARLKSTLLGMLPYHRQTWTAGTLFNAALQEPLAGLPPSQLDSPVDGSAAAQPEAEEVHARLLGPISSATARKGAPVEAAVTRPVFAAGHALLIPEGSLLLGEVVDAHPARCLHRNGNVHFVFHRIQLPSGAVHRIQGYLEGIEADFDAHLALDSEGAARARSPKTRFIFPAIAIAVTGLSFHQDIDAHGVPDRDSAGRAESGAVGLGLVGTVLAQASRSLASGIAVSGAAFSVYSTFLARGDDVVLPANTPLQVSLKSRGGEAQP
jgi:hypothetical protein